MAFDIQTKVLLAAFVIGTIAGATMTKTNFCTMGAVADWVNMGHLGRFRAWMLAIAVAIGGLALLQLGNSVQLPADTFPPYRTAQFAWLRYLLGGALFGIGMALGGGCGTKTLIRVGGGSLRALFVAAVIGIVVYATFTTSIFEILVMSWLEPTVVNLGARQIPAQGIDTMIGAATGLEARTSRLVVAAVAVAALLAFVFSSAQFRRNRNLILGGVVVGLAVVLGWFVTGGPYSAEWIDNAAMSMPQPSRVQVQSLTFVAPLGDTLRYVMRPTQTHLLSYGVVSVLGVVLGSFLYSLAKGRLRLEWFVSWRDFASHLVAGVLMGFGGVTAMGCTIGQGISGVSTLALGSVLALGAMIAGAAATIKLQYVLSD